MTILRFVLVFLFSLPAFADGQLMKVEAETFDGEEINFPQDLSASKINLLFLAMGKDQDNGQLQQKQLLEWQQQLDQAQAIPDGVICYHFPVMESPPFFVKGIIRKAMRESYEDKVPLNQAGVFYIDDLPAFANSAGLNLDGQPIIALATPDGKVVGSVSGAYTEQGLAQLQQLLQQHLQTAETTAPAESPAQ